MPHYLGAIPRSIIAVVVVLGGIAVLLLVADVQRHNEFRERTSERIAFDRLATVVGARFSPSDNDPRATTGTSSLRSFSDFRDAVRGKSDIGQSLPDNPFPRLLMDRDYGWLDRYPIGAVEVAEVPILWGKVAVRDPISSRRDVVHVLYLDGSVALRTVGALASEIRSIELKMEAEDMADNGKGPALTD